MKNLNKFFFANKNTIEDILKKSLKDIKKISVTDNSGGCGQAFIIEVVSGDFEKKSLLQQHRMLNDILKEEIVDVHSIQYKTKSNL